MGQRTYSEYPDHIKQTYSLLLFSCSLISNSETLSYGLQGSQASLSFTVSWSLLRLMPIESVMQFNHLILCHPFLLLPSIFPSIRVFSNESVLHVMYRKYWSFSFSISPSSEYSGLIFFRIDWFYLLAVQGSLKSLLQHHSSKASILWCSAFFIVHLSYLYITTGKTISFHYTDICWKSDVSSFVIAFLPRSKHLLISWLKSLSTVILEHKKIKSVIASTFFPSICREVMEMDAMILVFLMLSFKPAFSLLSFTLIKRLFHFTDQYKSRVYGCIFQTLISKKSWVLPQI